MMTPPKTYCTNSKKEEANLLDGFRVIHLHPTLKCNLKCKHCYSSSSPNSKGGLSSEDIIPFLKYAFQFGFDALSVSGGEPFLYAELGNVLQESKSIGYKNLVASNGMLLNTKRAKKIISWIDFIAISIDGKEALHDDIRGLNGAYNKMLQGIDVLSSLNQDFGLIHTITPKSWNSLLWLAEFAVEKGAKLLQLHPLELYGRAKQAFNTNAISQELLHKVFILGHYLKSKHYPQLIIQLDFLHREYIEKYPKTVTYYGLDFQAERTNFAQALKTIVIDERGDIFPISYGFSKHFKIGNIKEIREGKDVFHRFLSQKWDALYGLLEQTYNHIITDEENDLVAWTELIVKNSHKTQKHEITKSKSYQIANLRGKS